MWIRIEPFDVLLFRDARPFSAGESFRAASAGFPPSPLPFVGALRSTLFQGLGIDYADYREACRPGGRPTPAAADAAGRYGTPDDLGGLRFWGPFVEHPTLGPLVPRPLDLMRRDGDAGTTAFLAPAAHRWPGVRARGPELRPLRLSGEAREEEGPAYVPLGELAGYLSGASAARFVAEQELVCRESRTGIQRSEARTAEDGHLYTVEYLRLRDDVGDPPGQAGFRVRLQGVRPGDLPDRGILQLGGEGRRAHYQVLPDGDPGLPSPPALPGARSFKIVLLAPSVHGRGWLPDAVAKQGGEFRLDLGGGESARLVAAAVGKPLHLGGWDLAKGRPRTLLRAAPAGSVYFFEADADLSPEAAQALVARFHGGSTMQTDQDELRNFYRQAGFGLCLVGTWKPQEDSHE